jgi:enoyl-CoA hydratase/carnithine racemase
VFDGPFQVLVEGKASARAAVLNRPGHLNALTTTMVRAPSIPRLVDV